MEWKTIEPVNYNSMTPADQAYYRALDANAIGEPDQSEVTALLERVRRLDRKLAFDLGQAISGAITDAGQLGFVAGFGKREK